MKGVSCWNISVGASLSRSTPCTWSTRDSGSLWTQRKKKQEHEYPAVPMSPVTFHWLVNRKRVWDIFIWRGPTWPHTCMPTLALLSTVNILLQSDCQIFAFSSLQLNLEPSYLMAIMSPVVYYLIIWPIYFWPPYSAAHINGSSCGWPDVGLTSVWHCNTSCKTWCKCTMSAGGSHSRVLCQLYVCLVIFGGEEKKWDMPGNPAGTIACLW